MSVGVNGHVAMCGVGVVECAVLCGWVVWGEWCRVGVWKDSVVRVCRLSGKVIPLW